MIMLLEKEVIQIAEKYLKEKNRDFLRINKESIQYEEEKYINYGKYEEQYKNVFIVSYTEEAYLTPNLYFIAILAETGEVLYTASKHGYVEDWENDK